MANADFTPTKGAYTELKPFRFWCQKVLPLVYDDSLSYYELLCKVVDYLNKTMEDVDTLNSDVTNLFTAYDQLQDWVNAYYESADFEAAIDAGLDRMAEDGRLDALMTPVINEQLPGLVDDLLPEVVMTLLPDEVSSQIGGTVQTQLPGVVSNQIGPTVQTQLPGVVSNQIGGTVANQLPAVVSDQINDVVAEEIVDPVEDWLESNVSGGSAVDRTLSILGAGADAAFTGSRLDTLDNVIGYDHVADTGSFITTATPYAFNVEIINTFATFSDSGTHTYKMLVIPVNTGDKYCINAHKISIADITADHFAVTYAFCAKYVGDPQTDEPRYLPTTYSADDAQNLIVTAPEIVIPTGQGYDETTGYLVVITADIQDPVYKVNDAVIPALEARIDDVESSIEDLADTVEEGLANKANIDGYYAGLTAGAAEQLVSDQEVTDNMPYLIRRTGGGKDVGNREYDEIVGGSVVTNQLIQNGNFADGTDNWGHTTGSSIAVADGVCTFTTTTTSNRTHGITQVKDIISGHKYLCGATIKNLTSVDRTFYFKYSVSGYVNAASKVIATGATERVQSVFEATGTGTDIAVGTQANISPMDVFEVTNVILIDLTQMFGSTIANYVYTLDQTTAGAGITWLKSYGFFEDEYIPYNVGTLVHVSGLTAHVMRDGDNNVIGNYPLDSSLTLYGAPKLSNGQLIYDGDTYKSDGTVTRRFRVVDPSTFNWRYYTSGGHPYFYAESTIRFGNGVDGVGISDAYPFYGTMIGTALENNMPDKMFGFTSNSSAKYIYVKDSAYTNVADFKASLVGKTMIYLLASTSFTPEQAAPYAAMQICDPEGTEQYVTTGIPVGHNTRYISDLKGKLERLPDSAPADGTYLIQQTDGQMILIPAINALPAAPAADGTYTLKATVTDGNVSYFWEVTT